MKIRRFESDDVEDVVGWLKERDMTISITEDIPSLGVVAIADTNVKIAAGFLRLTDGNKTAWLEGLTTNPKESSQQRSRAIDLVVEGLIQKARDLGIKNIMAYTVEYSIILRSFAHGFKQCPHVLIGLQLEEGN